MQSLYKCEDEFILKHGVLRAGTVYKNMQMIPVVNRYS